MDDDGDFLNIFQDPILTLVALVLVSTLWVQIPHPSTPDTQLSSLQEELFEHEQKIDNINQIKSNLQQEIQKWRDRLSVNKSNKDESSKNQQQEITAMRSDLYELQHQVTEMEDEVDANQHRLRQMDEQPKKADTQYTEYTTDLTEGKKGFRFMLSRNKIFRETAENYESNYHIQQVFGNKNGQQAVYAELKAKSVVTGEDGDEIKSLESEFQKELERHNPEKEFIIFELHSDSFKTFRVARKIASKKGFASDWDPMRQTTYICISPDSVCGSGSSSPRQAARVY